MLLEKSLSKSLLLHSILLEAVYHGMSEAVVQADLVASKIPKPQRAPRERHANADHERSQKRHPMYIYASLKCIETHEASTVVKSGVT